MTRKTKEGARVGENKRNKSEIVQTFCREMKRVTCIRRRACTRLSCGERGGGRGERRED